MNRPFLFTIFTVVWLGQALVYHSLVTGVQMRNGDQVVSTLGRCKMTLISKDCALSFFSFNEAAQSYTSLQTNYKGIHQGSCQWLTVKGNKVVTDTDQPFLALTSNNTIKNYLMIDDQCTLRFIGIKQPLLGLPATDFQQIKFNNNTQVNQYIAILQSFKTLTQTFTNPVTNINSWIFFFTNTELTISKGNFFKVFTINTARFSQSGLFDNLNQTFPYVLFQGMRYSNLCGGNKQQLVGPFVVQVNQYWPLLRVYDQQGYKLFQFGGDSQSFDYNPCPSYLFMFRGDCLSICPTPHYHRLSNLKGECVLNCESNSLINNVTKTCECPNHSNQLYAFNCVGSQSYPLGCVCTNGTFLDIGSQKCQINCGNTTIGYQGICVSCGQNCLTCSALKNGSSLITCSQCQNGYNIINGYCVQQCPTNCLRCSGATCVACHPFYSLYNGVCFQQCPSGTQFSSQPNLVSACSPLNQVTNSSITCPLSCFQCLNPSLCIICKAGFMLVVTPPSTSCRQQTLLFSCNSLVYSSFNFHICYNNQSSAMSTMNKCFGQVANCFLCLYQSTTTCITCSNGYLLQQNACVVTCLKGYYKLNQACVKGLPKCQIHHFQSSSINSSISLNTITQNEAYLSYYQGKEQLNQPLGYSIFARRFYSFSNNASLSQTQLFWSQTLCAQCQNGHGLSKDQTTCLPCPNGCLLCLYAYNNSCIANNTQELSLYSIANSPSSCMGFLTQSSACVPSCPSNTFPSLDSATNKLRCLTVSQSSQSGSTNSYLTVDGCSFQLSSQKYLHKFIFSEPLKNRNMVVSRLLQNTKKISPDGSSVVIQSSQPSVTLNLSGVVQDYQSVNNNYPSSTVYGVSADTSFHSYLLQDYVWIGYLFSVAILVAHCIFVGNNYMYKMDNLLIFCQSVFFMLFIRVLTSNPVAQFYYGWNWTHLSFFPNYFRSFFSGTASSAPPYALFNLDANFIRNAGSSLSFFLTFLILWIIISLICCLIDKLGNYQIWFYYIFRNSFCATCELLSFSIFYWAVAYSHYDKDATSNDTLAGLTALCIITIIGYTIVRTRFDRIGGAYMVKRIVYASVLASSYDHLYYVAFIVLFQICFMIFRLLWEKPKRTAQKVYLVIEHTGISLGMVLLYLVSNVIFIALIVSILVYLWYLTIAVDLVDAFLISKNKAIYTSWLPCMAEPQGDDKGSSKEDIHIGAGTDRPFSSDVDK